MKFSHAFQTEEVDEPDIADSAVARQHGEWKLDCYCALR